MVRLSNTWTCSYAIARLQVNRLELTLSIGSFAAALGAMIAGIFGELIVVLCAVFSSHHQSVQHLTPNAAAVKFRAACMHHWDSSALLCPRSHDPHTMRFAGMNLRSTFEESVIGFWGTTAAIVLGCCWVFWAIMRYMRLRRIL
jgi:hypothetical protein